MNTSSELTLLYGAQIVGRILDAFYYDEDTGFGVFELASNPADQELHQRLLDFITFCKEWNERAQSESGADATEFHCYEELITSGLWTIEAPGGEKYQIEEAPCFFFGGEVSWRV
jgi:hypothetical protein